MGFENADVSNELADLGIDLNNLDQADGESSEIDLGALKELGIDLTPEKKSEVKTESKPAKDKKAVAQKEMSEVEKILKELGNAPTQHDADVEEEAASLGKDEDEPEEESEESDEDQPDEKESEDEFELVHKGETKKLNREEMKELAQKGFDYTQKTQELSRQRLALEEQAKEIEAKQLEFNKHIKEQSEKFNNELQVKQQWDYVIDTMKIDNPDLFEDVQNYFKRGVMQYNNPLVSQLRSELEQIKSKEYHKENADIANSYFSEMNSLKQELIPRIESLGIKVDEEKVKQAWIKGAENVRAAIYSIYGDALNKLQESKIKVNDIKRKTATSRRVAPIEKKDLSVNSGDYYAISRKILGFK